MAIVKPIENVAVWKEWVDSRPQVIKEMIEKLPPDRLYRMASGHRCTLYGYSEDGTVTVEVTGQFNRVLFSRKVFGIPMAELTECDLPDDGEDVGDTSAEAGFSKDDVKNILLPQLAADIAKREASIPGAGRGAIVNCPDCGAPMMLKNSRFGPFYGCARYPTCEATHGAHPDGRPLGVPGDAATKKARMAAHAEFDRLWKSPTGTMSRRTAYAHMARLMGMTAGQAHIARFTKAQCEALLSKLTKAVSLPTATLAIIDGPPEIGDKE